MVGPELFCFHKPYYVTKILNSDAEPTQRSQQKGKGKGNQRNREDKKCKESKKGEGGEKKMGEWRKSKTI